MTSNELTARQEEQDILFGVINRFIGYFTRTAVPHTTNDTTSEYPFVAMDTRQAYEQIRIAKHHLLKTRNGDQPLSFIDVGCGIGNILLLAECMDFTIFGIEKDSGSIGIARDLVGESFVSQEDIWHFRRLSDFDVVYYFRPFCEKFSQLKFEKLIEDSVKPGGVLIANRKMDTAIDGDKRYRRLSQQWPVWSRLE